MSSLWTEPWGAGGCWVSPREGCPVGGKEPRGASVCGRPTARHDRSHSHGAGRNGFYTSVRIWSCKSKVGLLYNNPDWTQVKPLAQ